MKELIFFILAIVSIPMVGCKKNSGPGNCPDHLSVNVQIKEIPVFSWDPACNAYGIIVYRHVKSPTGLQSLSPVWNLWSTDVDQNPIIPPITYGLSSNGVGVVVPAMQLTEGDKYTVKVMRNIDLFPGYEFIGEADFLYAP